MFCIKDKKKMDAVIAEKTESAQMEVRYEVIIEPLQTAATS